jgi:hypothetical protein
MISQEAGWWKGNDARERHMGTTHGNDARERRKVVHYGDIL